MASFGDFIKQERERLNWTQTDFGARLGINSGAISKIEHGVKQISAAKLAILAELFGIELSKLKEMYFADKIAREMFKHDCPETVFATAEINFRNLKLKNSKQIKLNF